MAGNIYLGTRISCRQAQRVHGLVRAMRDCLATRALVSKWWCAGCGTILLLIRSFSIIKKKAHLPLGLEWLLKPRRSNPKSRPALMHRFDRRR